MNGARAHARCQLGCADHRAAVVEDLDQIVLPDATSSGVSGIDAHDPVVVAVDEHAVVAHVVDGRLGLEAVPCVPPRIRVTYSWR